MVLVLLLFLHNCGFWLPKALPNREEGEPQPHQEGRKVCVNLAYSATAPARAQTSPVGELARFFPEATPVRIPVQFTRSSRTGDCSQPVASGLPEDTVIEFGTSREVLFACTTPLEFADVLRLRNSDGSLDTEASVVAVQYHPGATIVAARFLNAVPNWIVKS